ncbi:actin-like protein, partial [Leptotrombidium deliense]
RFRCPEALFQPSLLDKDLQGIHDSVFNSISLCDIDIRRHLYEKIIMAGGTTNFTIYAKLIIALCLKHIFQVSKYNCDIQQFIRHIYLVNQY